MEVILRQDVQSLGKAGEMVRVKPGYARNFLLPRGLAYEATEGNKKRIAGETRARTARQATEKSEAEATAAELGALTLTLSGKAGEEGKLFGSVTTQDMVEFLERHGVKIERKRLHLEEPIKSLGETSVSIRLHPDVVATLKVSVVRE